MPASRRAASALSMASRKARWAAMRAVGAWDWDGESGHATVEVASHTARGEPPANEHIQKMWKSC